MCNGVDALVGLRGGCSCSMFAGCCFSCAAAGAGEALLLLEGVQLLQLLVQLLVLPLLLAGLQLQVAGRAAACAARDMGMR